MAKETSARISGVFLPREKRIVIALTYVFGIGNSLSEKILTEGKIDPNTRTKDLSLEQVNKIREIIESTMKVEGDLRGQQLSNIKRLKETGTYRGMRHTKGLPSRGQRTKTNSRTVRGNVRRTMGSGRKPTAQKT
ncbi:30S ribosomal protein S13 [Patescibacteria group bacterium]|nr:30S ribosomal protein S13 [Patescibacteria group bacterium]